MAQRSRPSLFSKVKVLSAFRSRSKTLSNGAVNVSQALQEQLHRAPHAEKVFNASEGKVSDTELLLFLTGARDGMWLCCRGHENELTHYQGNHPFKYLTCYECNHLPCHKCKTTDILTPVKSITMEEFEPRFYDQHVEVRYVSVCQACGLTHRASMFNGRLHFRNTPCLCGQPPAEQGSQFHIGKPNKYHVDPQGQVVEIRLALTFAARDRVVAKNKAASGSQKCTCSARISIPTSPTSSNRPVFRHDCAGLQRT